MNSIKNEEFIYKAIDLQKNNTVVVVGAGGKTTFCLELSNELKKDNKVIYTTTTKIFPPKLEEGYNLCIGKEFIEEKILSNGLYIMGEKRDKDKKILPYNLDEIDKLKEKCDYLIIEGDGSKMKPLKGWSDKEPVFVESTDITLGVINIKAIGIKINETNVHRVDEFIKISNSTMDKRVNLANLVNTIENERGLFKKSLGKKILFINQVETKEEYINAINLVKKISERGISLNKVIISSLKEKKYYSIDII